MAVIFLLKNFFLRQHLFFLWIAKVKETTTEKNRAYKTLSTFDTLASAKHGHLNTSALDGQSGPQCAPRELRVELCVAESAVEDASMYDGVDDRLADPRTDPRTEPP